MNDITKQSRDVELDAAQRSRRHFEDRELRLRNEDDTEAWANAVVDLREADLRVDAAKAVSSWFDEPQFVS